MAKARQRLRHLSKVVTVPLDVSRIGGATQRFAEIPENETFRVRDIFERDSYSIPYLEPGLSTPVVVDIGANVGLFALYFAIRYPGSSIHCFEPAPTSLTLLSHNVGDLTAVSVHPFALSDRGGEAVLHLHRANSGEHSLCRSGPAYRGTVRVPVRAAGPALDTLRLASPIVLKIDTEGSEVPILKSLGSRLESFDFILVEYHSELDRRQIDTLLRQHVLFGGWAAWPGLGTLKYLHPKWMSRALRFHAAR
ncbi:MAG: FkbM family methyltransferase [Candidatus Hydrogenedentes bacterium]|nr:FkbM family methyltransferase [Candidatus Hydrogenedentota bacterium]